MIVDSKREQDLLRTQKELEKFQQNRIHEISRGVALPRPQPVRHVEEHKLPESSLVDTGAMGGQPAEGGALDEYDQMIFNQFMDEDEGEMMARKMQ